MDMIERAARALCEQHIRDVRRHDTELAALEKMLAGAIDYAWGDFVPQARTVLSALREPDEGMLEGPWTFNPAETSGLPPTQAMMKLVWQAMIDQALEG